MERTTLPIHEIRLGAIRAAIWANAGRDQWTYFNVTVSRLYKQGEQWRDSQSFGRDDLPVVSKVVDLAYAWIWNQGQAARRPSGATATD
jgi:hypothetical protein